MELGSDGKMVQPENPSSHYCRFSFLFPSLLFLQVPNSSEPLLFRSWHPHHYEARLLLRTYVSWTRKNAASHDAAIARTEDWPAACEWPRRSRGQDVESDDAEEAEPVSQNVLLSGPAPLSKDLRLRISHLFPPSSPLLFFLHMSVSRDNCPSGYCTRLGIKPMSCAVEVAEINRHNPVHVLKQELNLLPSNAAVGWLVSKARRRCWRVPIASSYIISPTRYQSRISAPGSVCGVQSGFKTALLSWIFQVQAPTFIGEVTWRMDLEDEDV